MFSYCPIKKRNCAFCGESKKVKYCGLVTGENRILKISKCPKDRKDKREAR